MKKSNIKLDAELLITGKEYIEFMEIKDQTTKTKIDDIYPNIFKMCPYCSNILDFGMESCDKCGKKQLYGTLDMYIHHINNPI